MRYLLIIFLAAAAVLSANAQSVDSMGTFDIQAVRVNPGKEDPAYRIMRMAIAAAPYHHARVGEYDADIYIKGGFEVVKVPGLFKKAVAKEFPEMKVGTRYVDESVGTVAFRKPNHIDQRVMKRTTSLPPSLRSDDPLGLLAIDIYNPRGIIVSPLSPGAFSHYKFRYEGWEEQAGKVIDKIRVLPTRHSSELADGYLYIVEGEWSVARYDLSGSLNVMSIDLSYRLQATLDDVGDGIRLPVRSSLSGQMKMLGGVVAGEYLKTTAYTRIAEDPAIARGAEVERPIDRNRQAYRVARNESRRTNPVPLDLTERMTDNHKVTVDSTAMAPDTLFWQTARPEPLAPDELKAYTLLKPGQGGIVDRSDTVPKRKQSAFSKVVFGRRRDRGVVWRGIVPTRVGFNTVDGFYFGLSPLAYRAKFGEGRDLRLTPDAGWAINRRALEWTVDARLRFAPLRRGEATLRAGSHSQDFAGSRTVDYSLPALVFRKNNLKLYEDNFAEATWTIDPLNGFTVLGSAKYSRRHVLDNSSDFSLFYRKKRQFKPNIPINGEAEIVPRDNIAAVVSVGLEYTPRYYYRLRGGRKEMVGSRWPTLFATWERGLRGVGRSDSDFEHWMFGVKQNLMLNGMSGLDYFVAGGVFTHSRDLFFADYRHFGSTDFPLIGSSIAHDNLFHLLPRYMFSTSHRYVEAHIYYQAPVILIKRIPWLGKRMWREGVQVNYLSTRAINNYTEIGYTVGGVIWQGGIFVGFDNFKYRSYGVKFSIPLNQFFRRQ